jgi:hypothetical protein
VRERKKVVVVEEGGRVIKGSKRQEVESEYEMTVKAASPAFLFDCQCHCLSVVLLELVQRFY